MGNFANPDDGCFICCLASFFSEFSLSLSLGTGCSMLTASKQKYVQEKSQSNRNINSVGNGQQGRNIAALFGLSRFQFGSVVISLLLQCKLQALPCNEPRIPEYFVQPGVLSRSLPIIFYVIYVLLYYSRHNALFKHHLREGW